MESVRSEYLYSLGCRECGNCMSVASKFGECVLWRMTLLCECMC